MSQRINQILKNPTYQDHLNHIKRHETERPFCTHDITHFLDVARIGYILNLEKELRIPQDIIYGAALLHDIGKWQQYEEGTAHEIASAKICAPILQAAGYHQEEIKRIQVAILSHRDAAIEGEESLSGLLFMADKLSRKCFECKMVNQCDWPYIIKNSHIVY